VHLSRIVPGDLPALLAYDPAAGALPLVGEALMPVARWEDVPLE
jgi:endonuclease G